MNNLLNVAEICDKDCLNGGRCEITKNSTNVATCQCTPGYEGVNCQTGKLKYFFCLLICLCLFI